MNIKADYGLYLHEEGNTKETTIEFNNFTIFSFTIIDEDLYSTTVNMNNDNIDYLLSVNFNNKILDKILEKTDKNTKDILLKDLKSDNTTKRKILLKKQINFSLEANLGDLEENEQEKFIPLVAVEVL